MYQFMGDSQYFNIQQDFSHFLLQDIHAYHMVFSSGCSFDIVIIKIRSGCPHFDEYRKLVLCVEYLHFLPY